MTAYCRFIANLGKEVESCGRFEKEHCTHKGALQKITLAYPRAGAKHGVLRACGVYDAGSPSCRIAARAKGHKANELPTLAVTKNQILSS